jgi:hypothetical protein
MTRFSKQDQFDGIADAYHQIKHGEMPHQVGAKDGSIATHPVLEIIPACEAQVQAECLRWLKQHRIPCDRLNNGKGDFGSGYATYGIIGAGDIVGWLPKTGQHYEIEVKAGAGGRLSKVQQERQQLLADTNALYFIIHGVEELEYYFKGLI